MIISQDTAPERSLYYLGYQVLQLLKSENAASSDPKLLYDKFLLIYPSSNLSFNYFLYAVDWLYILDLVELTDNIRLKKCF
jgi:hypothetical protein